MRPVLLSLLASRHILRLGRGHQWLPTCLDLRPLRSTRIYRIGKAAKPQIGTTHMTLDRYISISILTANPCVVSKQTARTLRHFRLSVVVTSLIIHCRPSSNTCHFYFCDNLNEGRLILIIFYCCIFNELLRKQVG